MQKIAPFNLPYIAVATEAFRMARNSAEFFAEISCEFGINFKIIDGISEAKFTKMAIENRLEILKIPHENSLFIDLGGASTEISYGEISQSFKFGIVRFLSQNLSAKEITNEALNFIKSQNFKQIVLTSGVPTTIVSLKKGLNYKNYDANLVNGEKISFKDFANCLEMVRNLSDIKATEKLGENRKDLIICGIILLQNLLTDHANSEFLVIDDGLREGVAIAKIKNLI